MTGEYQHSIDTKGRLFIPASLREELGDTIYVNAAKCTLDAQGRILLPQKLRAFANLKKDVMVLGVSNHAEIWDKDAWAKVSEIEMDPVSLEAAVDELNF